MADAELKSEASMSAEPDAAIAVYATFPDFATAEATGRRVVEKGLAACVNLLPSMRSIYRWQGAIEEADEVVAIFKSRAGRAEVLIAALEEAHPYDTPAIVVLPIEKGSRRYLDWILAETAD
jgi:periplasmic divalent cation tolerance protein